MSIFDRFRSSTFQAPPAFTFPSAIAVIDASTIYGASRWYRSVHRDQTWAYAKQYRAAEDKLLFEEFLHDLLLYDSIVLDCSSLDKVSDEIVGLIDIINRGANAQLISGRKIAPDFAISDVVDHVCNFLSEANSNQSLRDALLSIPVPWYYSVPRHHDRSAFELAANRWNMPGNLIPSAIFLYRGLCYSGYANSYVKRQHVPAVYLASPGRLRVMQPILSADAMQLLSYPRQAYADLVDLLGLPSDGYDFSHLKLNNGTQLSELGRAVSKKSPEGALDYVLRLRSTAGSVKMRSEWAKRIWESSRSSVVGAPGVEGSNIAVGNTIYGNLTMVIHAQARST